MITPVADAYQDSVPTVFVTGQVPSFASGTDAFQEGDTVVLPEAVAVTTTVCRPARTWLQASR